MTNKPILPGESICILGAGQLGKMSLIAAHQMGFQSMVWAPEGDIPAMEMASDRLVAPYTCKTTFDDVLRVASVITTEWENIPLDLIAKLEERGAIVRPGYKVLEVAQSRRKEKAMAAELGIKTTPTVSITAGADISTDGWSEYLPGILKSDRLGYDGKGQWRVKSVADLQTAVNEAGVNCVLEKQVDFVCEASILVARSPEGTVMLSDVVENTHKNGILKTTVWPAKSAFEFWRYICDAIEDAAVKVAHHLELEGVLCLEFFVTEGSTILFNEMAPRPHNSFHGSIEAARTSQFEQHVRAICGLPLGEVRFHTPFEMHNLIGGGWDAWSKAFEDPNARLHLYGKKESRDDRKMGHVTKLKPRE